MDEDPKAFEAGRVWWDRLGWLERPRGWARGLDRGASTGDGPRWARRGGGVGGGREAAGRDASMDRMLGSGLMAGRDHGRGALDRGWRGGSDRVEGNGGGGWDGGPRAVPT